MRAPPEFPAYRVARPPVTPRWLAAGALLMLLCGGVTGLLRGKDAGAGVAFFVMLITLACVVFCWLLRFLYYRFSVHYSQTWAQEVAQEKDDWWQQHCRTFCLAEVALVGPSGIEPVDWQRVLNREQSPPPPQQEAQGQALRLARTFSPDMDARERQLARLLVLQWKTQREDAPSAPVQRYFWRGSDSAWQAFSAQLQESFPGIAVPERPEPWQGEKTLSAIAAMAHDDAGEACCLVAGCLSLPALVDAVRPAGESAVLWLTGRDGPVTLSRGEVFDASTTESLQQVCLRAQKQRGLDAPPDACMLFSHPEQLALPGCGWNVAHHLQDSYWGDVGYLDALIVIALAALFAQHQSTPCGWIAADPLHALALGIVTPNGNR